MNKKEHRRKPPADASGRVEQNADSAAKTQKPIAAMVEQCACCPGVMGRMMEKTRARHTTRPDPVKP